MAITFGRGPRDDNTPEPSVGSAARPTAGAALGASTVRDINGKRVPLVVPGEPAVIMVSSRSCTWCMQTLADLRVLAAGRPLPRLRLVTLEGAAEGVEMVAREKLTGVQTLGPVSGSDQVFLTFRYPGTPTLLVVDRDGRVVKTIPGYPDTKTLRMLYAVMAGDADTP